MCCKQKECALTFAWGWFVSQTIGNSWPRWGFYGNVCIIQQAASPGVSDLCSLREEGKVGFSFVCNNTRFFSFVLCVFVDKKRIQTMIVFVLLSETLFHESQLWGGLVVWHQMIASQAVHVPWDLHVVASLCQGISAMGIAAALNVDLGLHLGEGPEGISCNDILSSGLIKASLQKRDL